MYVKAVWNMRFSYNSFNCEVTGAGWKTWYLPIGQTWRENVSASHIDTCVPIRTSVPFSLLHIHTLFLCLIKHYAMKTWGSGGIAPLFLISTLHAGEWLDSLTFRFASGERAPGTHWMEGWVSTRAGLDAVENIKILQCRESNPDHPDRSTYVYRLSYPDSPQIYST
jgi:hypothetical protein